MVLPLELSAIVARVGVRRVIGSIFASGACVLSIRKGSKCMLVSVKSVTPVGRNIRRGYKAMRTLFLARARCSRVCNVGSLLQLCPSYAICASSFNGRTLNSSGLGFSHCRGSPMV